jgi:histidine triad (HIT) family protein
MDTFTHELELASQQQAVIENCLFCKIVNGLIPARIVFQDPACTVFEDIHPQAPVHLLIVSSTHTVSHLETENDAIYRDLLVTARKVAKQLNLTDYRLVMNNGAGAGQSVFHMHLHLLAGRPFTWPAG